MLRITKSIKENTDLKNEKNFRSAVILFLIGAFILQQIVYISKDKDITVHIPPQFNQEGGVIKAGEHPKVQVFGYTNYIWGYLNHWPEDGSKEYKQNIQNLSFYLTGNFIDYLKNDYEERLNSRGINELDDRRREITLLTEQFPYNQRTVKIISDGVWDVSLYYQLKEYVGSTPVKKRDVKYTFRVIGSKADPARNQWGLKIDELKQIETIKEYQL